MLNTICDAIVGRNLVSLYYDGGVMIVEPHCFGVLPNGNQGLVAYQIRGHNVLGTMGWRVFDLGKAANVAVQEEVFREREDYARGEWLTRIYCEV